MIIDFYITILKISLFSKIQFLKCFLLKEFCRQIIQMKDFLFNDDLEIRNGDFAIGESDNQHVKHILMAGKGEYKANPELGVGVEVLATEEPIDFFIEAKKNLEYDGMKVNNISFTEAGKVNVDAKYID